MCTVTFLPKGKSDYILTSNRDESPKRAALAPQPYQIGNTTVYFPKDPLAGGTWIATDKKRFTLCLLNGGFEKHSHTPPYRMSRGQMVLQFFEFNNVTNFKNTFEFNGMEPFTLVIVASNTDQTTLDQLVWNGESLHEKSLDTEETHIWSSSILYPQQARDERHSSFSLWVNGQTVFDQKEIMSFHKFGGNGDVRNDLVMNRDEVVKTVSITSVEKAAEAFAFIHDDLLKEKAP